MIYEALLLFGLCFVASFLLLTVLRWADPLSVQQRSILQVLLFVLSGAYFVHSWTRSGQTLAMRAWRLRLVDRQGGRLSTRTAVLRYLAAWSLFLPGLLLALLLRTGIWGSLALIGLGVVAMLLPIYAGTQRQALHDRLLGTRLIRDPPR